jgi:GTP-binding protein HflX
LKEKLKELQKQRRIRRRARSRREVFSVALVGYTNAGKSTLFNALTHPSAGAYVADKLFATLDTTTRKVWMEGASPDRAGLQVVVADTVGFIRDLPHGLVAAFRATLDETVRADLLLHVVDSASPARVREAEDVNKVLAEIHADAIPQIAVWNKVDVSGLAPEVERDEYGRISRVFVSAHTGAGLTGLRAAIAEAAQPRKQSGQARDPSQNPSFELSI